MIRTASPSASSSSSSPSSPHQALPPAQSNSLTRSEFWVPLLAFLAISALVFAFTARKQEERVDRLRRQTDSTLTGLTRRLQDTVSQRIALVQHLRELETQGLLRDDAAFAQLATTYAEQFHLAAIAELGKDGVVQRVWPSGEGPARLFDPNQGGDAEAAPFLSRAVAEQADLVTPALRRKTGGWGFLGYFPRVVDGRVSSVLAVFFRYVDLVEYEVDSTTLTELDLLMRDEAFGNVVYERWRGEPAKPGPLLSRSELRIAGHRYVIEAVPGPLLVAETWRGIWLERLFGFLLAALVAFSVRQLMRRGSELARRDQLITGLLGELPLTVFRIDARGVLVEARGRDPQALGLGQPGQPDFGREPGALAEAMAAAREGRPAGCELQVGNAYFELSLLPDAVHPGEVVGFAHEVTRHHQVEAALRRSEGQYRGFFHEAPFGYLVTDREGIIELANPEAAKIFHRSEIQLLGRQVLDVFGAGKKDRLAAAQLLEKIEQGEEIRDQELRLTRQDGKTFWCSLSVQAVTEDGDYAGGRFVFFDITRRKDLEERLRQTGKMEAVGRLAGGITHDFNNLLTAIMGFARIARGRLPAASPLERELGEIEKAGKRATALVARLLAFSRQQPSEAQVVEINARVRDLAAMLRRMVREDIELELRLGDAGSARIDPSQLEQVLVNLVLNGMEAITGRGHIVVETSTRHATGEMPQSRIRVIDDGRGMSPEVQQHLFEPFFTTKTEEEGSGLGLATVYGIVEQHGGQIQVDSEPELGTTITLLFPRVAAEEGPLVIPTSVSLPPSGKEKVLVVEDEEQVRDMAQEMLEILGYQVTAARDGRHALELVAGRESEYDLLLSDVIMPHVGGEALYHALKARHPGLKVLFTSGYTDDPFIRKSVEAGELPFLQKPYTLDSLAVALRHALREHQP